MSKSIAFSGQLRQYMAAKKITQEQFCEKFEIGKTTIYRILSDSKSPLAKVAGGRAVSKILPKLEKDKVWQQIIGAVENGPLKGKSVTSAAPETVVFSDVVDEPQASTAAEETEEESIQRRFGRSRAFDSTRFRTYVAESSYRRRNLIVFVREYPTDMKQDVRDCLKTLLELHLEEFTGLISGDRIVVKNRNGIDVFERQQPPMSLAIKIQEKYNKPIHKFFDYWAEKHVVGRTAAEVLRDGVELLVVEPDPSSRYILDAWQLRGVAPGNTGFSEHIRNVTRAPNDSKVVYEIPLHCGSIETGECVREYGQACLNLLGKTANESLSK